MMFNVVCETDTSAGRAMAKRRGVGPVRHLDTRLFNSCAQKAWSKFEPGTKMVDLGRMTSLLKGTPLWPPMGWSSWMVATTLPPVAEAAKHCHALI